MNFVHKKLLRELDVKVKSLEILMNRNKRWKKDTL